MDYPKDDDRPKVALFRDTGLLARLICWQTRSQYSHAAILLPDTGSGVRTVIEAYPGAGVRYRDLAPEDFLQIDLYDVVGRNGMLITYALWLSVLDSAKGQLGKPYYWLGDFRFVDHVKAAADESSWFCSELVFWSFQKTNLNLLLNIDPAEVSPAMLALSPRLIPMHAGADGPMVATQRRLFQHRTARGLSPALPGLLLLLCLLLSGCMVTLSATGMGGKAGLLGTGAALSALGIYKLAKPAAPVAPPITSDEAQGAKATE